MLLTAQRGIGAKLQAALGITDDHIRVADTGGNAQVHQKIPAGNAALAVIGGGKGGQGGGVALKLFQRVIFQVISNQRAEGGAYQQQCRQQNNGSRKEIAAEGGFHSSQHLEFVFALHIIDLSQRRDQGCGLCERMETFVFMFLL